MEKKVKDTSEKGEMGAFSCKIQLLHLVDVKKYNHNILCFCLDNAYTPH